ncbi:PucR family transcriptional regulator ligand-binding domain-containing protein [Streptomyces sp. NPDC060011]|uniref:PucR family transcriptional regulator ligand-binding domain-containing protein n=1 Tax=Streptomyces sp. NPDC060011 TaxID=3347037 RepID=UPI00369256E9
MPDPRSPSAPQAPAVAPAPAVPPTPPVALSALLAREDLGLRRIAGPAGSGTVIRWAHTSEMSDPYPYLLGGELLLTAGVHVPDPAAGPDAPSRAGDATGRLREYFDAYVSRIVAAGGAALGFGLAPVHDRVPPELVAACDAHGLPLLEVPPRTTFSGVARAVWQLMAQARLAELRRVTEAQQSLAAAAARPDPVPAVLRQLAQRVGGLAVLYGPEGTELARAGRIPDASTTGSAYGRGASGDASPEGPTATSAGGATGTPGATRASTTAGALDDSPANPSAGTPADPPAGGTGSADARLAATPAEAALAELAGVVRPWEGAGAASPRPSSATDTVGGVHLAAYALGSGQGFVLGVAAPRRDPGDHTGSSRAAVVRPGRPRWCGCCSVPRPRRWRRSSAASGGPSCTRTVPGKGRRRTPSPPPRWGRLSAPRWSTWRVTWSASSSPVTACPPSSPAGPAGSARPPARTPGRRPTPRPPARWPAPERPAPPWSGTASAPRSPISSRRATPRPTPSPSSLPSRGRPR